MKIITRLVLLAIVCGLGFWLWTVFFPSPEKIILKKIASLAETATLDAAANNLTRAGKAVKLSGFFSTDAQIVINIPGEVDSTVSGREEIKERAMAGFARISALKVQFFDVTAKVGPDKLTADVSCTAQINIGNSKDFGVQELHFQFGKIDGNWLITHVETVQTLQ